MTADLELLGRAQAAPVDAAPRRKGAFVVGLVVVLGVLVWAFLLVRPYLGSPRHVMTAAVRVEKGAGRRTSAVEATGWLEPDPFPVVVRPLVEGVVERLEVVEGQDVVAGQTVIARLRNVELEAVAETSSRRAVRVAAQLPEVQADLAQAEGLLAQRIELRRDVARFEGEIRTAKAERALAQAEVAVAEHEEVALRAELAGQDALLAQNGGTPVTRAKAAAAVETAQATVAARRAAVEKSDAAVAAAEAQLALAKEAFAEPVALRAAVATTKARLAAAEADLRLAETERDVALRQVALLEVRAPVSGRVLWRNAEPGSSAGPGGRRMGGAEGDVSAPGGGSSGTLASLYDPARIQARIDVPLASVAGVGAGQDAELRVETVPGRVFHGVVSRVVSQADPLKNTLQVKVRISDPDPALLKPEMLVRARFLAVSPAADAPAAATARVLVPKASVRSGAVFVFDPRAGGRARRVPVKVVAEEGDVAEVTGDVGATNVVILDPVEDGDRVTEDMP